MTVKSEKIPKCLYYSKKYTKTIALTWVQRTKVFKNYTYHLRPNTTSVETSSYRLVDMERCPSSSKSGNEVEWNMAPQ